MVTKKVEKIPQPAKNKVQEEFVEPLRDERSMANWHNVRVLAKNPGKLLRLRERFEGKQRDEISTNKLAQYNIAKAVQETAKDSGVKIDDAFEAIQTYVNNHF